MELNILNLTTESLLMVLIILIVLQCYGVIKCQEGASMGKQRFAGIRSEGLASVTEGFGLSGADYNGGHLNFESTHSDGRVVSSGRNVDTMEGLASVTEGLNLIDSEGYTEGLNLIE